MGRQQPRPDAGMDAGMGTGWELPLHPNPPPSLPWNPWHHQQLPGWALGIFSSRGSGTGITDSALAGAGESNQECWSWIRRKISRKIPTSGSWDSLPLARSQPDPHRNKGFYQILVRATQESPWERSSLEFPFPLGSGAGVPVDTGMSLAGTTSIPARPAVPHPMDSLSPSSSSSLGVEELLPWKIKGFRMLQVQDLLPFQLPTPGHHPWWL